MNTIHVSMNPAQLRKFSKGGAVQLSHHSLMHGGSGIDMTAEMPMKHINRLMKNLKDGKGFRLHPDHVMGGSILHHVKHFAKELLKKQSTKDLISAGLSAGAVAAGTYFGHPEAGLAAAPIIHGIVNADYRVKPETVAKKLQDQATVAAQQQINNQVDLAKQQASAAAEPYLSPYNPNGMYDVNGVDPFLQYQMYGYGIHGKKKRGRKSKKEKEMEAAMVEAVVEEKPKRRHRRRKSEMEEEDGDGLKKGSVEAKMWGQKMKRLRKHKTDGGSIGSDILKGLKTAGHYLIPATTGVVGGIGGEALGGPVGAMAGSALGSYAGHQIDQKLGIGIGKRIRRKRGGSLKSVGNEILSGLKTVATHALPVAGSAIGAAGGMELGGPAGAILGSAGGAWAGEQANKAIGLGLHPHKLGARIHVLGGNIVGGVPNPIMSAQAIANYHNRIHTGKLLLGGSFAPLGGQ